MSCGRAIRLCAALATAAPISCAAVGPDSPPFEVLSIQPATESLAAETIYPLTTTQWTYETAQPGIASPQIDRPVTAPPITAIQNSGIAR